MWWWVPAVATAVLVGSVAACGGSSGSDVLVLSDAGERGREVSMTSGCAACHGTEGEGTPLGPPLVGLAGSTVPLADGSSVTADESYLIEAIVDPSATVRAGWDDSMPERELSSGDLDDLLVFILELSDQPPAAGLGG